MRILFGMLFGMCCICQSVSILKWPGVFKVYEEEPEEIAPEEPSVEVVEEPEPAPPPKGTWQAAGILS